MPTVLTGIAAFTLVVLTLAGVLMLARHVFVPSGTVRVVVNGGGEHDVQGRAGDTLLALFSGAGVYLPAACGGKGTCGACRVRIESGVAALLPSEAPHITRGEARRGWRLACQTKVMGDLAVELPPEVLSVGHWVCTVASTRSVATFIREIVLELPEGEKLGFRAAAGLARAASTMRVGDPRRLETTVGPLIRSTEVTRVSEWLREAVDGGGKLIGGGAVLSPSTMEPAVLFDPPAGARVSTREIFGPVACVYPYADIDEAIDRANSLPWAFQASVFTRDIDMALRASRRLAASAVMVNDHSAFRADWMPFAGLRRSGLGTGGMPYTLREMQTEKMVVFKSVELL